MKTFKQYLLEQDQHNPHGYDLSPFIRIITEIQEHRAEEYGFIGDGDDKPWRVMERELTNLLSKHFTGIDVEFTIDDELAITVDTDSFSKSHVNGLKNKVLSQLYDILQIRGSLSTYEVICFREAIPAGIVSDFELFEFYLPWAKPFTLAKIDKQLPQAKLITINYPEKIIGNALGLVKIKSLQQVSWSGNGSTPKWLEIINDQLHDHNIIAAQEELFKNGFDEYAKL